MNTLDRSQPPAVADSKVVALPEVVHWERGRWQALQCVARDVPLFHASILFDRGLLSEPEAVAGRWGVAVAAIVEGTRTHSGASLMQRVEELGGDLSASLGWQSTGVQVSGHLDQSEALLELLCETVAEPEFDAGAIERLRSERVATLHRLRHQAGALGDAQLMTLLYSGRAGMPTVGSEGSLNPRFGDSEAAEGWRTLGAASRSGLIWSAGKMLDDGARARLVDCVDSASAKLSASHAVSGPADSSHGVATAAHSEPAIVVVDRPQAAQTEMRIGQLSVARGHGARPARRLLNAVFGGQFTSRLNLRLRERDACTYGASSAFVERRADGFFRVASAIETEKVGIAVEGVLEEMLRLQSEPVQQSEVEDARSYLVGVQPFRLQTLHGVSAQLQLQWLYELERDALAQETAALRDPCAADLQQAACELWSVENLQIVAVGPAEPLQRQLAPLARRTDRSLVVVRASEVLPCEHSD